MSWSRTADHGFGLLARPVGSGRPLETVFEAGDLVAGVGVHLLEPAENAVGVVGELGSLVLGQELVVLGSALIHPGEADAVCHRDSGQ